MCLCYEIGFDHAFDEFCGVDLVRGHVGNYVVLAEVLHKPGYFVHVCRDLLVTTNLFKLFVDIEQQDEYCFQMQHATPVNVSAQLLTFVDGGTIKKKALDILERLLQYVDALLSVLLLQCGVNEAVFGTICFFFGHKVAMTNILFFFVADFRH